MGDKRKSGVLLTRNELRKRYPDSGLAEEIYIPTEASLRLPSTILAVNDHMGGGIGYGKIIELFGEESTGKSALAQNFAYVAQLLGGIVLWNDAECSFDGKWFKAHGLDLTKLELLPYENIIEVISDWIYDMVIFYRSQLTHNEPILWVIDSLAVLEVRNAMETAEADTKAEMGRRSFMMGSLLRKRTKMLAKYGVCVIMINQLRKKIGVTQWEDPDTSPMAQPMKYYAAQRIGLYRGKRIKQGGNEKGRWVGNHVHIRTKKNKTSPPRDTIQAEFYFREDEGKFGFHKYNGFDELLLKRGIIKKSGNSYKYKGETIAIGRDKLTKVIATNDQLRSKLIKKMGINTVSKTREQLKSIINNMFPVKITKAKDETQE